MVAVYAIALVAGVISAVPFVMGFDRHPPRLVVASLLGFGMAGMSSSFAGWADGLAVGAAVVGALALSIIAIYLVEDHVGENGP